MADVGTAEFTAVHPRDTQRRQHDRAHRATRQAMAEGDAGDERGQHGEGGATRTLTTVVSIRASMKAVNITAQQQAEAHKP